jgi:hypothetical protein
MALAAQCLSINFNNGGNNITHGQTISLSFNEFIIMKKIVIPLLLSSFSMSCFAYEDEWHGLIDIRLLNSNSEHSWLNDGLDKQRFDNNDSPLQLGQAILDYHAELTDTINSHIWLNGYDHRDKGVALGEAYVKWRPIPTSAWRWQSKIGMFFPELSLENSGLGWTSNYLISSSAINTWVGEELRTLGAEVGVHYDGARVGSPHDWRASAAAFRWNDPAGGLLTWRGWSIGDRVTGSLEQVPFPELAIFDNNGYWAGQIQGIKPFREIDNKTGYYANFAYQYLNLVSISAMRYDNRGDPKAFVAGQWAWDTTFNHLAVRSHYQKTTLLAQYMTGQTIMGYVPFHDLIVDYRSWYVLLSQQMGAHQVNIRYDKFWLYDQDHKAADPNQEYGDGLAIGWKWNLRQDLDISTEWLRQRSDRDARAILLGQEAERTEDLWQGRIRWWF